jgi:hypothetical protein
MVKPNTAILMSVVAALYMFRSSLLIPPLGENNTFVLAQVFGSSSAVAGTELKILIAPKHRTN